MRAFKAIVFPARWMVTLCGKVFSFSPWLSIVLLVLLGGLANILFMGLVEVVWPDGVIEGHVKVASIIAFLLFWQVNIFFLYGAIFVFLIGACSARPPAESKGYILYDSFVRFSTGNKP